MTTTSPLRRPKSPEGGGFATAHFPARRARYGAAPPAPRVRRIALRSTALRAALDPGDHYAPGARKTGQAQTCPRDARGAQPRRGRAPGRRGNPGLSAVRTDVLVIAVSKIAANAVRYGSSAARLLLVAGGAAQAEVRDSGGSTVILRLSLPARRRAGGPR